MKKLIAWMCCLMVTAVVAQAQQAPKAARINAAVQKQTLRAANRQAPAKVTIPGPKRIVNVRLEVQELEDNEQWVLHRYWNCPAVIFNKEGALAFDGECWQGFEAAAQLQVGPVVYFTVDLGNFGEYSSGEYAGNLFFFSASYVAVGPGDEYSHSVDESFKLSNDKTYIVYKRSLFNDPNNEGNADNSQVKKAIADYYTQNNLKEVTAETLSKYFAQQHPRTKREVTRYPY